MPASSPSAPDRRAGTMKASASSPAGTTVLRPLSVWPLPAAVARVATWFRR
jgi:hypothetical protein